MRLYAQAARKEGRHMTLDEVRTVVGGALNTVVMTSYPGHARKVKLQSFRQCAVVAVEAEEPLIRQLRNILKANKELAVLGRFEVWLRKLEQLDFGPAVDQP